MSGRLNYDEYRLRVLVSEASNNHPRTFDNMKNLSLFTVTPDERYIPHGIAEKSSSVVGVVSILVVCMNHITCNY